MSATSVQNSRDEMQLVDRFLAGDKDAFAELIRPHVGALYGVALAILKDEHDAEETLQDAVLKAMTHLAGFRRESKFSTWITQITINEGRMKLRKARRHIYRSLDEETTADESEYRPRDLADWREIPSESLERTELRDALERALNALSPAAREVILLRDVQNYSTAETAKARSPEAPCPKIGASHPSMAGGSGSPRRMLSNRILSGHGWRRSAAVSPRAPRSARARYGAYGLMNFARVMSINRNTLLRSIDFD